VQPSLNAAEPAPDREWRQAVYGVIWGVVVAALLVFVTYMFVPSDQGVPGWLVATRFVLGGAFGLAVGMAVARKRSVLPILGLLLLCMGGAFLEFMGFLLGLSVYPLVALGVGGGIIALAVVMAKRSAA
jgi:hypothetical protein